ncbi:hypothetical protein SAMN04515671_4311 [Nakamurella panacisegetis]|uniref:Uncharacterized protein n=1 Tax=Nakamurella panacisegetis TaxID=1090615 RepID=A0A1H0SVH0_9ACTN|nr:hypothetical protein SAMN04515671_4311 [Nakamurella panacisegetis]
MRVSASNPDWAYAHEGIYDDRGQLASDYDQVIVNLRTHAVIGPTNVGFCGAGPAASGPIGGYSSVPTRVLRDLGLAACAGSAAASPSGSTTAPGPEPGTPFAQFAGRWGAHESALVVDSSGHGTLTYADLSKCPNCALADAPAGTLTFVLTTSAGGAASGRVTASSDVQVWAVGAPVSVRIVAGSPGQLLQVTIAGKSLLPFCNQTSAGQCGA